MDGGGLAYEKWVWLGACWLANDAQLVYFFVCVMHAELPCHIKCRGSQQKNIENEKKQENSEQIRAKSRAKSKPTIFFRIISVGLPLTAQTERDS